MTLNDNKSIRGIVRDTSRNLQGKLQSWPPLRPFVRLTYAVYKAALTFMP